MLNIGLIGKMRSGKDTVAAYLCEHYQFTQFAFGDGIKRLCMQLFPDQMRDAKPRALLQGVGQSLRNFDQDVWLNRTMNEIEVRRQLGSAGNAVISDARQPNEIEKLKSLGFVLIRINTPDEVRIERMQASGDSFKPEDLVHETEASIDLYPVNYEVYNTGGFVNLYYQLDYVMADIIHKQTNK
jgi:dephospho-CoA kinase